MEMVMKKETTAPKLVEPTPGTTETVETTEAVTPITIPAETMEELDEEEKEFRTLRRDLPGVKGSSAAGIVTISVGKTPPKNEFFRTHPEFRPIVSIVNVEVGMEKLFFAVTADMIAALAGIGITVSDYALYLTVTARGVRRVVPVGKPTATAIRTNTIAPRKSVWTKASASGCACSPTWRTNAMTCSPRRPDGLASRNFRT
jgi:hypothetical protein